MEVSKKELVRYLELVILKGEVENKGALVKISDDKIFTRLVSSNSIVASEITLAGKFEDLGDLGFDDLVLLKNFLNSSISSDKINLVLNNNKIVIKENKTKLASTLINPKYVVNTLAEDVYNNLRDKAIGNAFVIPKAELTRIQQAFSATSSSMFKISGKDKLINFTFENLQNEISLDFEVAKEVKEFSTLLPSLFSIILAIPSSDVTMSVNTGCPVFFQVKEGNFTANYLIAPKSKKE